MFTADAAALMIGGFAVSAAAMPACIRAASRLGLLDRPGHRKEQSASVPLLGGAGIFAGILLPLAAHVLLEPDALMPAERAKIWTVLAASLALAAAGLADDRRPMSPRAKAAVQASVAALFAWFGYRFDFLQFPGIPPLGLHLLAVPFTAMWIVAVVNGFNLADGSDGLAGSIAAASAVIVALCGARSGDGAALALSAACAGAALAFLLFNWKPARVYMGDAGSQGIGMLIAALLVSLGQESPAFMRDPILSEGTFVDYHVPLATAAAIYPLAEAALSALRRAVASRPIGRADLGHIHHRLKAAGWSAPLIALWAAGTAAMSGAGVVLMLTSFRGLSVWFFLAAAFILTAGLGLGGCLDTFLPSGIRIARPSHALAERFAAMQKAKLELAATVDAAWRIFEEACIEFGVERYRAMAASGIDGDTAARGGASAQDVGSPEAGRQEAGGAGTPKAAGTCAEADARFKQRLGASALTASASGAGSASGPPAVPGERLRTDRPALLREWVRPPDAAPEHLVPIFSASMPRAVSDRADATNGGAWIEWEAIARWSGKDIETDCRTIFSELARIAIERARELGAGGPKADPGGAAHPA